MTEHQMSDFYAKTAIQYGQCKIKKDIVLYSPAGIKTLHVIDKNTGEPFDHTEADYWIINQNHIIPMYGAENITEYLNAIHEKAALGFVLPVTFKTNMTSGIVRNQSGKAIRLSYTN